MTDPGKETLSKIHGVRWSPEQWATIEKAAAALTRRTHIGVDPTDIIRSGTMKFASEVLAGEEAGLVA